MEITATQINNTIGELNERLYRISSNVSKPASWALIPTRGTKQGRSTPSDLLIKRIIGICTSSELIDRIKENFTVTSGLKVDGMTMHKFDYKYLSVSVIEIPIASYNFAHQYYSLEMFGPILDALARPLGLRITPLGVSLRVNDGDVFIKDILISRQWADALILLGGYPHNANIRYSEDQGIDVKASLSWVTTIKYFNRESIFTFEPTAEDKVFYTLEDPFSDIKNILLLYPLLTSKFDFSVSHSHPWLTTIEKGHPNVVSEAIEAIENMKFNKLLSAKFNDQLIIEITGLNVEDLESFKEHYISSNFPNPKSFERFILSGMSDKIKDSILLAKEKYIWLKSIPKLEQKVKGKDDEFKKATGVASPDPVMEKLREKMKQPSLDVASTRHGVLYRTSPY